MNKNFRTLIIVVVVLIGVVALVGTGVVLGRSVWNMGGFFPGRMMGYFDQNNQDVRFGNNMGSVMMNRSGMMGSQGSYGMMGGSNVGLSSVEPLSIDETREAVEAYLISFGNNDLVIEEIMVFDNNAYAIVIEESTGIGAFELLIDPVSKAVFPEYGPNMMWNQKYGMHAGGNNMMGRGMMGGSMMGGYNFNSGNTPEVSSDMTVSADEAAEIAQRYLDTTNPGVVVSDEVTAFYGYYTIDLEQDGEIVGMLSVNGFSGQVFPHTWHGDFIEMANESDHE